MSYDLGLKDPATNAWIELDRRHHLEGGTCLLGGCPTATFNITYNCSWHFNRVLPRRCDSEPGIRSIYGMTGAASIPVLEDAVSKLCDDVSENYRKKTEGNAKMALRKCITLAKMAPEGVWDGD